ncbi:MAG: N-acetylmuramoyl-L-alanine amidase [Acidobacteria bacterium]|nr:N-acetylmuramoyl-L-alanine amidase [Acidobacteriota bacterium]
MKHLLFAMVAGAVLVARPAPAGGQPARELYQRAVGKDEALRTAVAAGDRSPAAKEFRDTIGAYEVVVRRYPKSGYSDNALLKAAALARLANERFGDARDRRTAVRLLRTLVDQYPTSSLVAGARTELEGLAPASQSTGPMPRSPSTLGATPAPAPRPGAAVPTVGPPAPPADTVVLRSVTRTVLPGTIRISLELDREVLFEQARIDHPSRVFVDLKGTTPGPKLVDAVFTYTDDLVRQIRIGRHPGRTTRVVMDAEGIAKYSLFTLYQPFRLVIDCERTMQPSVGAPPRPLAYVPKPVAAAVPSRPIPRAEVLARVGLPTVLPRSIQIPAPPELVTTQMLLDSPPPIQARATAPPSVSAPSLPSANRRGGYSLARQLGLGVSRIVIDPGHGGHDPGAKIRGLTEADVALDIALRLSKLLDKEPGVEVVLTRKKNEFIPLEQRTAIANRENADMFVSIHVNANSNPTAHGIETFFLNFASNPEAAAVAARENTVSGQSMHNLNDIVKAIALNNKLDESRDLATQVQDAMVKRAKSSNKTVRDLGVKQAPFVVLVGASMPSILAEVSFITNRQESQLLKTTAYRQRLAEALMDGIRKYQRSLKGTQTTALQ